MSVRFEVNGKQVEVEVEPRLTLADCLRHHLRLTGTHVGCEHGVCGACTVIVDGDGGALLPDARGAGRREPRWYGRRPVERSGPHAAAEILPQASRIAVRLLHARHDHHRARAAERGAGMRRRRACARCCPATFAAAPATSPSSRRCSMRAPPTSAKADAHEDRQLVHRQPDRAPRGPALSARPRSSMSTISRARACCTRRSCAARSRTAAFARSMLRPRCALAGVHSVITAKDIGDRVPRVPMRLQPLPEFEPFGQPVIAETKVRYVGEAIALVLADSPGIAEDASGLIEVDIEPLPPVADWHASAKNETLLFESQGNKPRDQVPCRARRRCRGVQGRALHPARALPHPAAHGAAHGAARPACRVGCAHAGGSPSPAPPRCCFSTVARWRSRWAFRKARSRWWRTTSAAASARAASSIRRIS